jgi:hypothetical protein
LALLVLAQNVVVKSGFLDPPATADLKLGDLENKDRFIALNSETRNHVKIARFLLEEVNFRPLRIVSLLHKWETTYGRRKSQQL